MLVVGHCGPGSDFFFLIICGRAIVLHVLASLQDGMSRARWEWNEEVFSLCELENLLVLWVRLSRTIALKLCWPLSWGERPCMPKTDLRVQVEKGSCVCLQQPFPSCACWPYREPVPLTQLLSMLLGCWTQTERGLFTSRFVRII